MNLLASTTLYYHLYHVSHIITLDFAPSIVLLVNTSFQSLEDCYGTSLIITTNSSLTQSVQET